MLPERNELCHRVARGQMNLGCAFPPRKDQQHVRASRMAEVRGQRAVVECGPNC